jgi:hypothetical protein
MQPGLVHGEMLQTIDYRRIGDEKERFSLVGTQGHCFSARNAKARELRHLMGFVVGVGCSIEAPLPGE